MIDVLGDEGCKLRGKGRNSKPGPVHKWVEGSGPRFRFRAAALAYAFEFRVGSSKRSGHGHTGRSDAPVN
eukprot:538884-Rhodomonas_salina.1